mmetsp:Transcript_26421/g.26310  ORF Transcript_26421/g.26310 Transcript_26421/m.26310 type:complete len:104 (-) Transcript_26421:13-324(-)
MAQSEKIQSQNREIRSHEIQINRFKIEELRKNARIKSQVDAVKQRNEKIKSLRTERDELIKDKTRMEQEIINLDPSNKELSIKNLEKDDKIVELERRIHGADK